MYMLPELHRASGLGVSESGLADFRMFGSPADWYRSHPYRELTDRAVCQWIKAVHLHYHERWREHLQDTGLKMKR